MADDLIHEVEESLKQEKMEKLWKEYGGYLIAAIIMAVLLTAIITGWRSWNSKINARQTSAIIEALAEENQINELNIITAGLRPGQRAVSHLTSAGLLLRDNQKEEALEHYKIAAHDKNIQPVFRDLAQLMVVRLEWSMKNSDTKPQEMLAMLKPLWQNKDNPWQSHAHMQAAIILAHADADYKTAREHLNMVISATDIPASLIERARALDQVYAFKMTKQDMIKGEPEG